MSDYEPKCKKTLPIIFDDRMPASNLTPKLVGRVNDNTEDLKNLYEETETMQGDINELETTKADASGTSENLTAGNAEQLLTDKGVTDKVPYLLRASGGNGADREEDKIIGGTVAWNQYLLSADNIFSGNYNTTTITNDTSNKKSTAVGTGTYPYLQCELIDGEQSPGIINTHVYLMVVNLAMNISSGSLLQGEFIIFNANNVSQRVYPNYANGVNNNIFKATVDAGSLKVQYQIKKSTNFVSGESITLSNTCLIDLTQMFGSTIADRAYAMEQSTAGSGIAWLKSMGFFTADYYPYDAGTLKSVEGLTAHRMVGFNQWDEEWEVGGIDSSTGQNDSSANGIRTKNYISVIPNTTYYCYVSGLTSSNFKTRWYDANKNYIGTSPSVYYGNTFVTPSNAYYLRFCPQDTYGTTYNHDICINLSDPAKNGTYEPYTKRSYPLDNTLTLRGIPKLDANNQVYYDGDEYASDGTVTRRYGVVDLGTLNWIYYPDRDVFYTAVSGIDRFGHKVICSKYPLDIRAIAEMSDKSLSITSDGSETVWIKDTSYGSDANAFKTSLNGVYFVYKKATETTESADPYTNPQILDPYGTEAYETTDIVPVGHDTLYPENLRKKIEDAPSSPTADGDYILRRTSGVNTYATAPGMDVVTVSGTTVTQTGEANKFYVCGTLATLTFTAPSSGICGIRFTSGSTATVLTVSGVSYWMNGFNPSSLEANKTYEISILNGVGVVGC